ncbi:RNA-directed DNA polymerase, eukaryota [Tanacetum coccineum]
MATSTRCTAGAFPFSYLGIPIGYNMNRVPGWQILIDCFKPRLSSWKANLLSIEGRLTLIKSVLGNLGIYFLLIFKALEIILKALKSLRANFFWGDSQDSKKLAWIKWTNVLSSFEKGSKYWLYRLERDKDCLIIDRINNGHWSWNWSRSDIGVRNMAYLHDLLLEISLVDTHPVEDSYPYPSLVISTSWDTILPRKVNIFIWRLSLDRFPHRLNLSWRGIDILKISCSSCNGNVESSNHIFFACNIAMEVWRLVRNWCDITFPLFASFEHWIELVRRSTVFEREEKSFFYVIVAFFSFVALRFRNSGAYDMQLGRLAYVSLVNCQGSRGNAPDGVLNDIFGALGSCLWTRFIKAIYGKDDALNSPSSLSKRSPWLDIIREDTVLRTKGINLLDSIPKKVGNGLVMSLKLISFLVDTFRRPPRGGVEEEELGFLLYSLGWSDMTNIPDC